MYVENVQRDTLLEMAGMDRRLRVLVFASMVLNLLFLGWMLVSRETEDMLAYVRVAVFEGEGEPLATS